MFDFAACQRYSRTSGGLTQIVVERLPRPRSLPRPYEYSLPIAKVTEFVTELREACRVLLATPNLQMLFMDKKGISKGIKLTVFGLTSYDHPTPADWLHVVETIQAVYHKYLGPEALLYAEPLGERKSQLRHQAYIMYAELGGLPQSST